MPTVQLVFRKPSNGDAKNEDLSQISRLTIAAKRAQDARWDNQNPRIRSKAVTFSSIGANTLKSDLNP